MAQETAVIAAAHEERTPGGAPMPSPGTKREFPHPNAPPALASAAHPEDAGAADPIGAPTPPDPPLDEEPIPPTLRMISPDDAARAALNGIACELGVDELRVLARIGERLRIGQRIYGRLYIPVDTRNFRSIEARQELEDALVYLACAWLRSEIQEVAR